MGSQQSLLKEYEEDGKLASLNNQQKLIWALIVGLLVFFLLVWIMQLCWNNSATKLFSGAKKSNYTVMLLFVIFIVLLVSIAFPTKMIKGMNM
jgi:hypothetical protein